MPVRRALLVPGNLGSAPGPYAPQSITLTSNQVGVGNASNQLAGGTDLTFTNDTAAKLMTITSTSSTALIRVTPVASGNSGFSNTTSAHPGTGGGLFLPFVSGGQSDGPGVWWTNGTYGGLAGIWLSGGFNLQGWNSSNSSLKVRKGTGTSSDGAVMFTLDPDTPAMTLGEAANIVLGTTTGTKIGTSTTQKLAFYNSTPIVQPSAYTQTYATADKTHADFTSADLATTAATQTTPWGFASQAQAENIATQFNLLRADVADLKQLVNSLIDDLQALGLIG